ncbi:MAG: hypothetical protein ACOYOA_12080 [Saprospiraceae bacterium]
MDLTKEKIELIRQIALLDDESLIEAIKNLVSFGVKKQHAEAIDFWETLSEKQKQRIELSIQSIENGNTTAHRDVMKEFRKQYHS